MPPRSKSASNGQEKKRGRKPGRKKGKRKSESPPRSKSASNGQEKKRGRKPGTKKDEKSSKTSSRTKSASAGLKAKRGQKPCESVLPSSEYTDMLFSSDLLNSINMRKLIKLKYELEEKWRNLSNLYWKIRDPKVLKYRNIENKCERRWREIAILQLQRREPEKKLQRREPECDAGFWKYVDDLDTLVCDPTEHLSLPVIDGVIKEHGIKMALKVIVEDSEKAIYDERKPKE